MAQDTTYDVVANFKAHGDLQKKVKQMSRGLPVMDRQLAQISQTTRNMGRAIEGTAARTAMSWGSAGIKIAGFAATLGGGLLIRGGLKFNKIMEDTRLEAATMFQMFRLSEGQIGKNASLGAQWAQNLKNADFVMQGLFNVAKKTPASFQQVTTTYKGMAAGITLATTDLKRQLKFMESVSLLGGLAGGDYTVLGAQMGRILAGSAGAEMNIWKVISEPILNAGKSMKLFNKEMQIGGNLTKAFNELSSPERLAILEKAMSAFGEEMKIAYAESMAGIVSTTQSQLQILTGMGTKPVYEGFRKWLIQLNRSNKEVTNLDRRRAQDIGAPGARFGMRDAQKQGLFSDYNMRRWSVLFETIGIHLGALGQRIFDGLESAGYYILDNWPRMMETFRSAWDYGVAAFKGMMALMIARMAIGRGVAVAGVGLGAGAGVLGGLMKILGLGGKGAKAGHGVGTRGVKDMNLFEVATKPFRAILNYMKPFIGALSGFLIVAVPLLLVIAALGVAFAGLSVLAGGLAVYVVTHWQELMTAVSSGKVVFDKFREGAMTLWNTLLKIGETLVGGKGPADTLQKALDKLGAAMTWLARQMGPILHAFADVLEVELKRNQVNRLSAQALYGLSGGLYDITDEYKERENMTAGWISGLRKIADAGTAAAEQQVDAQQRATLARARLRAQGNAEDQQQAASGKGPKGTNVNIQTVIVNQDLRGLDPDRVFASFLPALERVANQRTQAHGMVPQGA